MGIRGWAWDLETNTKTEREDDFAKLIFRKKGGWIVPDERELRELTNRRGAILVRNCLLEILPKDLIEDALGRCRQTLESEGAQDPDGARKKVIVAFSSLNITPVMLEELLGHPLAQSSPKEIADLRQIYTSIRDGNSRWQEYLEAKQAADSAANGAGSKPPDKGALVMEDLMAPAEPDKDIKLEGAQVR